MSSFIFFFLSILACFINIVYSQCLGAVGIPNAYGLGYEADFAPAAALAPGFASPGAYGLGIGPGAIAEFPAAIEMSAYAGSGIGDVVVAGEMPVVGTTLVTGQVPILGAVRFAGDLPAAGTVSISGTCGCGGGAYIY